jgi:hypothetical protein
MSIAGRLLLSADGYSGVFLLHSDGHGEVKWLCVSGVTLLYGETRRDDVGSDCGELFSHDAATASTPHTIGGFKVHAASGSRGVVDGKLGCSRIGSVLCVPLQLRLMTDGVLSLSDCRSDSYHCDYNDYGNRRPIGVKHDREQYYPTR